MEGTMASLSPEKLRNMRNKYDHQVARFLAGWMINERKLLTYVQLGEASADQHAVGATLSAG